MNIVDKKIKEAKLKAQEDIANEFPQSKIIFNETQILVDEDLDITEEVQKTLIKKLIKKVNKHN